MAKRAVIRVVNERARKEKGLQGGLISLIMEKGEGNLGDEEGHTFAESGE